METTMERDTIESIVEEADVDGLEHLVTDSWVQFALPTHGGGCDTCTTERTRPMMAWIEDGTVKGGMGAQCGGCGAYSAGWLTTDPVDLDAVDDPEARIRDMIRDLVLERDSVRAHRAELVRQDLRAQLTEAVRMRDEDPDASWPPSDEDRPWITGSEETPGVYGDEHGELHAWDWLGGGDVFEVAESELDLTSVDVHFTSF